LRADDFAPEYQDFDTKQKEVILANLKKRETLPATDKQPATTKADDRPTKWARKLTLEGVENFYKVSDVLYRSAQPTAEGMKNLEKMGIKTIVNLRSFHSDRDEMRGTKMGYEHITMKAWHAEDKEIVRFLKILINKKNQPVLVHCRYGADRTGTMCALYRVAIEGWTKEEAIEEMTKGGYGYHTIWGNLITYIQKLDIEKIKEEAGLKN
jgi:protein tyrosine/serine phosphatase